MLIAIVSALALAALGLATLAESPDERPALVLLTNGRVLEGQLRREEDRLVVVFPSGEIRLRRDEVQAICRDLDEAYHVQRRKLQPRDFAGHVELAEWCLR